MEVFKAEILKRLEVGVIYPISDSQWISLVQVVPKKTSITVVKNKDDELVPTRIQNELRLDQKIRRRRHSLAHSAPSRTDVCPLDSAMHRPYSNGVWFLQEIHSGLRQDRIYHVKTVAGRCPV
ncbi:uncharacterized protein [Henckelia pumila]|uniref:uncharacterized protein n=1 Tax=Henckelia pumila TaxID=405737 RepID=UPI003C6DDB3B